MKDYTKKELQKYQIKIDSGLTDGVSEIVEEVLPDILNGLYYLSVGGTTSGGCKTRLREELHKAIFYSIRVGLKS